MMTAIQINPRFQSLIPPITDSERSALESSLIAEGCRDALVLWNDTLIDGHNRLAICTQHGLPYTIVQREFASEDAAAIWIIQNQLARRNLSAYDRSRLALQLEPLLTAEGKARQAAAGGDHGNQYTGGKVAVCQNSDKPPNQAEPFDRKKAIAAAAGVSHDTIAKVKVIEAKAPPEVKAALHRGEVSIHEVHKDIVAKVKKEQRLQEIEEQIAAMAKQPPEIPVGPFHVISIDPPWPYGTPYDPDGRRAANPYPEMSLEELAALELPAAEDCVLWLWTTHKFMRHAFPLLDTWGFQDKVILTWVKDRMGLGSWLRSQSEFCIMAVRGNPVINLTNQTTVIQGPLREHSRKPDSFYDLVDSLCIGAKLDYFSREKRDGWHQVGNTTELFNEQL